MNSGHRKKLEKVEEFIQLAFDADASLKYRSLFDSTDSKQVTCANSDLKKFIKNKTLSNIHLLNSVFMLLQTYLPSYLIFNTCLT